MISLPIHVVQKREQKKELGQVNGLVDKSGKRTTSPTSDADLLDRSSSSIRANAHARILERRASRPGTPTSNASTETPNSEQNDVDEDIIDVDDDSAIAEMDCGQPQLKRPFELLIAAAMERNPTQFQLPNELTCTTALPGERWLVQWWGRCLQLHPAAILPLSTPYSLLVVAPVVLAVTEVPLVLL